MALFPQRFIDDLRLQANIVQVVQEYVSLKRAGRVHKGLCPFHSEKTPSFQVDPDKGFFYCFGCHVGGDVFKFLELQEKVSFPEAVKLLASKFGVALPEPAEGEGDDTQRRDAALREALLKIHEMAAAYFREQLAAAGGARARRQLEERGIKPLTVDELGLGFAPPNREGLKARLSAQGFSQALLLQSGLVAQRETGELVDRFRNRLIVPICRDTGSVIAFGGRQMDPDQGGPKYLNSPETPIYSKSRTLYGLNLSKGAIRKQGYALLVEGYFDFAQVFQSGAFSGGAPVVASCGTALTEQQAQLLRRFTTNVKLNFDPDSAGQSAATRSCELLAHQGFEVKVVLLDKGEDPDTFIRKRGDDEYRAKLRTSVPYFEYVALREASQHDLRSMAGRNAYIDRMQAFSSLMADEATRELFAERVAERIGVTGTTVLAQFRRAFVRKEATKTPILGRAGEIKDVERALIWWLMNRPAAALDTLADIQDIDLQNLATAEVLQVARSLQNTPAELFPSTLIGRLSSMGAQMVMEIASGKAPPATELAGCVETLKFRQLERLRVEIQQKIEENPHSPEVNELSTRLLSLAVELDRYKTGTRVQ